MTEEFEIRFLNARQRYIAGQFQNLNNMQRKAVMTTEGPLLLLAGAGSGKTTVLLHRIANLIRFGRGSDTREIPDTVTEEDVLLLERLDQFSTAQDLARAEYLCAVEPVRPWNMIAVTFTNKAAKELKERLVSIVGPDANDVWAMTFHSACCRILRKDIDRFGYTGSFTIYDTSDSERVMKDILKDMGLDEKTFPAKYVLSLISREKDKMVTPKELLLRAQQQGDYKLLPVAKAYEKYQNRLKENNALDFDDILVLTVRLLQEYEDVRTYYQRKFRYVLVDEYQDTNHVQYLLTSLLAGGYENICVVGDDDQSIYRFRGATIANILDFEKQYRGAQLIRLEQNYRSTQSILNGANAVISHNLGRKGKRLWTSNVAGDAITVYEAPDELAEANYVANEILKLSQGKNFRKCAILYRTNAQSNALERAMKSNGIPYRIIGGTRFFDRAEVKDMLEYLWVINNQNDDLRLNRIINNPPRGLGAKSLETAQRLAQTSQVPLYYVISNPLEFAPLEKTAGKFKNFAAMIENLKDMLHSNISLPDFYEKVMELSGYADMLREKDTEESRNKLDNIRELKSSIVSYAEQAEEPSLSGFLEEIALYTDIENYNEDDEAIVMMTMHASKGLEFSHVFVVGMEEGLFPGARAIGEYEEMEEERRLCYVAITRAKETLTMTHARQRMLYGKTSASMQSRFLKELPQEEIRRLGSYQMPQYHSDSPYRSTQDLRYTPSYPKSVKAVLSSVPTGTKKAEYLRLNKGDMVQHTAFGKGMVLSVMDLGSDALLEIAFDQIGTKKLMAKTASVHMKKL